MKKNTVIRFAVMFKLVVLAVLVSSFSFNAYGQFGESPFSSAEPGIETEAKYEEGLILFKFDMDENHHITDLKNNFFKILLEKNDFLEIRDTIFPEGVPYEDEMVFKGQFNVKVYVKSLKAINAPVNLKFKVSYQVCQEQPISACFPPKDKNLELAVKQTFKEVKIVKQPETAIAPLKDLSSKTSVSTFKPKGGNWLLLLLVAMGLLAVGIFVGLSGIHADDGMGAKFSKAVVVMLLLTGAFLFLKALDIKYYPAKYSQKPKNTAVLNWIGNLDEGKAIAEKENKHVLIDTYADWCIACKELEEYTLSDAGVAKVLENYVLVKVDFTKMTAENKKLQSHLKVIGMPTGILLTPDGKEMRRFSGFLNKEKFLAFLGSGVEPGWLDKLLALLKEELEKRSLLLFALVFALGFLTSLTPCVYPVIPIVMGYIGTRSGKNKFKGFYLSIFFVLGLAFVYSLLGVIAAMAGSMVGVSFQNPIVVIVIAAIFMVMGLSLAGLFEIPVPSSISSKVQAGGKKSEIISALVVGGVAGIIAAPCAGPVLITLLSWISQTKSAVLGFLLTFTFSLGMGIIFLVVGTFSGVISALPKGGKWMDYIKYFFAVILIGGGIYILATIAPAWLNLLLWGIFLVFLCVFLGLLKTHDEYKIKDKAFKFVIVVIFLTGIFLFFKSLELRYFTVTPAAAEKEIVQKAPLLK